MLGSTWHKTLASKQCPKITRLDEESQNLNSFFFFGFWTLQRINLSHMSRSCFMIMDPPKLFEEENRHYHVVIPSAARTSKKPTKKYHKYKFCMINVSYGLALLQFFFKTWRKHFKMSQGVYLLIGWLGGWWNFQNSNFFRPVKKLNRGGKNILF